MELREPIHMKGTVTIGDTLLTMFLLSIIVLYAAAIVWPQKKETICVGSHDETQYIRVQTMTADGIESVYKPIHVEVCDLRKERNIP